MSRWNPFLAAALTASAQGWSVFPLVPGEKVPAVRGWELRATIDPRQIRRWWAGDARNNIGIAAGKSGLIVIDLDGGRGDSPPPQFAGARGGADVLAMLASAAGESMPVDTYTVATPGGRHLYFRLPDGVTCRNSAGSLGWRVDSRSTGGYVVAAGSVREQGPYRVTRSGSVATLPEWLAHALAPPAPPDSRPARQLPDRRASAYVRAIVVRETDAVASAQSGTRHHTLLSAARTLGQLVGGDELTEHEARALLLNASVVHVGVDGCTAVEVSRTVSDGLAYGRRCPRRITRDRSGAVVRRRPDLDGQRIVSWRDRWSR